MRNIYILWIFIIQDYLEKSTKSLSKKKSCLFIGQSYCITNFSPTFCHYYYTKSIFSTCRMQLIFFWFLFYREVLKILTESNSWLLIHVLYIFKSCRVVLISMGYMHGTEGKISWSTIILSRMAPGNIYSWCSVLFVRV